MSYCDICGSQSRILRNVDLGSEEGYGFVRVCPSCEEAREEERLAEFALGDEDEDDEEARREEDERLAKLELAQYEREEARWASREEPPWC